MNSWQISLTFHFDRVILRQLIWLTQYKYNKPNKRVKCLLSLLLLLTSTQLHAAKLVMNFFIEPPFVRHADQQLTGLHIDIFKQLQQQQRKVAFKVQLLPLKRAYLLSSQLPNNCIFGIERTPTRETDFVWVAPLYTSHYAIYQRPQAKHDLEQLKKLSVGSYLGSGITEYLNAAGYQVNLAKTNLNSAKKLQRKRIHAWASDVLSAAYILQHYSLKINPQGQLFYKTKRAIACNKNTKLDDLINLQQGLNQLHQDGVIEIIIKRYEQQYKVNLGQ